MDYFTYPEVTAFRTFKLVKLLMFKSKILLIICVTSFSLYLFSSNK